MNSNTTVTTGAAVYVTTVTVTLTGGAPDAVVDLVLGGAAYKFNSSAGPTTTQVTLVAGEAEVDIWTAPTNQVANGSGTLSATISGQTPPCPAQSANLTRQAQELSFVSNFGIGFYPNTPGPVPSNTPGPGTIQFDTNNTGPVADRKYLRVSGTVPGDVVSNIYAELAISTGWTSQITWSRIGGTPGSNVNWSTPVYVRTANGRRVYRTSYTGTVTATGSVTELPIGFYFRQQNATFYANQTGITTRFATVNGVQLQYRGPVAAIVNTNVAASAAPRP